MDHPLPTGAVGLGDGRRLAYDLLGDPGGRPVLLLPGTPGSRLQLASADEPARRLGVRLVVPDRPGYGASTHHPGRTLLSWAADVRILASHLRLDPFVVVGLSGGGPHALAVGRAMADRVPAVATIGSPAPRHPAEPSLPPERLMGRLARRSVFLARLAFAGLLEFGRRNPSAALDRLAAAMAETDAALLATDAALRAAFLADLAHRAPTAARAAARDFRLFVTPWDFRLEEIDVPVHVWHGTEDRNVPVEHAAVIARRCPRAELHLVPGAGHLLLASHADDVFATLG